MFELGISIARGLAEMQARQIETDKLIAKMSYLSWEEYCNKQQVLFAPFPYYQPTLRTMELQFPST